jgi:hypothetical protein
MSAQPVPPWGVLNNKDKKVRDKQINKDKQDKQDKQITRKPTYLLVVLISIGGDYPN